MQEDDDLNEVPLLCAGQRMEYVAQLSLQLDSGEVETNLITHLEKEDSTVSEAISDMEEKMDALMQEPIAVSEVDLVAFDPKDTASRLTTIKETNLGDLCADAYRQVLDADVGLDVLVSTYSQLNSASYRSPDDGIWLADSETTLKSGS